VISYRIRIKLQNGNIAILDIAHSQLDYYLEGVKNVRDFFTYSSVINMHGESIKRLKGY
jgi:hypothetical protein